MAHAMQQLPFRGVETGSKVAILPVRIVRKRSFHEGSGHRARARTAVRWHPAPHPHAHGPGEEANVRQQQQGGCRARQVSGSNCEGQQRLVTRIYKFLQASGFPVTPPTAGSTSPTPCLAARCVCRRRLSEHRRGPSVPLRCADRATAHEKSGKYNSSCSAVAWAVFFICCKNPQINFQFLDELTFFFYFQYFLIFRCKKRKRLPKNLRPRWKIKTL